MGVEELKGWFEIGEEMLGRSMIIPDDCSAYIRVELADERLQDVDLSEQTPWSPRLGRSRIISLISLEPINKECRE